MEIKPGINSPTLWKLTRILIAVGVTDFGVPEGSISTKIDKKEKELEEMTDEEESWRKTRIKALPILPAVY